MDESAIKIFISYAHDDDKRFNVFAKTLKTHLKSRKKFKYASWDDDNIPIGTPYNKEIKQQLTDCDLAILCISANFLASDFIKVKEFGVLIKEFPNTLLAPFLFSPCDYKSWDTLAERQFFKPNGDRYNEATNEDFTFADLVQFNKKDGDLVDNTNIDRYIKDFIAEIEKTLENQKPITAPKRIEIEKHLPNYITSNYPYFEKNNFFGRKELLKEIDDKLKTLDIPLLLSGIGGMGKTAVAVAYGKDKTYCTAYDNIAWVGVTENIFSNIFSTFHNNTVIPFEYSPDGDGAKDIAKFFDLLKQVKGNNLLLVDNANEEADLLNFVNEWKENQPDWKCMVTTRCENDDYKDHQMRLPVISLVAAEELFKKHNDKVFEKDFFKQIYDYIGGHTFLIELLAKYGKENSTINSTEKLLAHIKEKGLKALSRKALAKRAHLKATNDLVSQFVLGLYDPTTLNEKEQEYMLYFSVLPATDIEFEKLDDLFGIEKNDEENFDIQLNSLVKRGWLMHNASNFKCHQIIQEICKEKLKPDAKNCSTLISSLADLFENINTTQSVPFFEIGLSIASNITGIDINLAVMQFHLADRMKETGNLTDSFSLLTNAKNIFSDLKNNDMAGICLERMGTIYRTQGNMEDAMKYFQQYNSIGKELLEKNADNVEHKNNLAISYQKIGTIYEAQGNLEDAMECYQQFNFIEKELSAKNPHNVTYKHNLAISYQKTGIIYEGQGNLEDAMKCHQQHNSIEKELSEKNPDNVEYKNNLAVSNQNLGIIYEAQGNLEDAMKCYQEYNSIEKELSEKNPRHLEYKNLLGISYQYLGVIYEAQGNLEDAMKCYQQHNSIEKELSEKNPDNVEYKNGLAISYSKLAGLSSAAEAREYYTKAKEIWEDLVIRVPQNAEYKKNLEWVKNILKNQ